MTSPTGSETDKDAKAAQDASQSNQMDEIERQKILEDEQRQRDRKDGRRRVEAVDWPGSPTSRRASGGR